MTRNPRIEDALRAWHTRRAELLENDPELANDEAALVDLLGPEEGEINNILVRIIRATIHAERMEELARNAYKQLASRAHRFAARSEKLRATAKEIMDATGLRKLELPEATVTIKTGVPATRVTDLAAIPDEYKNTVITANKAALLPLLKAGQQIPGVELSNPEPSLSIKVS